MKLAVLAMLMLTGCAAHRKPEVWRFNKCAKSGDHIVCECSSEHEELNAKSGARVRVCD